MISVFGYGPLKLGARVERIRRFVGRMFDKDELLFRENLMDHAGRLVPAHAGGHQKKRHPRHESSASQRHNREKAVTITNAVPKWHSICLMYRAFANYPAFRDVAAASALTSLSAIAVSLRSASPSSSSVACSLSAASLSPNRVASVRAVPYPAIS